MQFASAVRTKTLSFTAASPPSAIFTHAALSPTEVAARMRVRYASESRGFRCNAWRASSTAFCMYCRMPAR